MWGSVFCPHSMVSVCFWQKVRDCSSRFVCTFQPHYYTSGLDINRFSQSNRCHSDNRSVCNNWNVSLVHIWTEKEIGLFYLTVGSLLFRLGVVRESLTEDCYVKPSDQGLNTCIHSEKKEAVNLSKRCKTVLITCRQRLPSPTWTATSSGTPLWKCTSALQYVTHDIHTHISHISRSFHCRWLGCTLWLRSLSPVCHLVLLFIDLTLWIF